MVRCGFQEGWSVDSAGCVLEGITLEIIRLIWEFAIIKVR